MILQPDQYHPHKQRTMLNRFIFFMAMGFIAGASLAQNAPLNVTQTGHLPYPTRLSDVWAYVDSAGHEYALVGVFNGFSIVDLADPAKPVELQFIPGVSTIWRDCILYGHHAYVSNDADSGLLIIDLSTLPGTVAYKDTILNGLTNAHNVWQHDGYLYQAGANFNNGLDIFDVKTDPWNPSYVGSYNDRYVHDVYIRNDTAYVAEINEGFLSILDVSDKSNISVLGSRTYLNANTHNTWLNDAGDVCFTTDEVGAGYIIAWDVSDPTDIRELDRIRSSLSEGFATPHNAHVLNDWIVTSYYSDGIHIVDAHRPENLVEVGHYDTSPLAGPGFIGCWGAYPFLPSGLILAADIETGLYILRPSYKRAAYLEGQVTEMGTGTPISQVEVHITGPGIKDMTTTGGEYATGLPENGTFTVTFDKHGYERKEITTTLSRGQVTIEDVELVKSTPLSLTIKVIDKVSGNPVNDAKVAAFAVGAEFLYATDANGEASDPNFLSGGYDFVVEKWGYLPQVANFNVTTNQNIVTLELEKGYYDDFLFDMGWIKETRATQGNFELGVPNVTGFGGFPLNPDRDVRDDFGEACYVTGNQGSTPFDDEVSGGLTGLISPPLDLTTYQDPIVSFHWWMVDAGPGQFGPVKGNDTLFVELITGAGPTQLAAIDSGFNNFWSEISFRVRDFMTPDQNMRLRVSIDDDDPDHLVEVGIDKFTVREGASTAIDPSILAEISMKIYPIPAGNTLYVDYDLTQTGFQGEISFEILDIQGRSLRRYSLYEPLGRLEADLDLPSGVYLGVLRLDGQAVISKKIIK